MAGPKDVEEILLTLRDESPSGFAIGCHIRFTTPDFLFQTYPKAWLKYYSQEGLVMFDPIVGWCFGNTGAIRWSKLGEIDEKGVLDKAKEFDMAYGVAMAVEVDDSRSVAGFSRSDREFTDAEITMLEGQLRKVHDLTARNVLVDPAEREILRKLSVSFTHPEDDSLT